MNKRKSNFFRIFWLESTFFGILVSHHQVLSIFNLLSAPERITMFLTLRLSYNNIPIFHIKFRESIVSFIVETFWSLFRWDPCMVLQYFLFFKSYRIDFFNNPKELIFQQFRALLFTLNNIKMFLHIFFMLFVALLEQFFQITS